MGILELQEARRPFSRVGPERGRSLSFNREVGSDGSRGKGSPQFSHSGGTDPNRCHCAKCTTLTPGLKIYRNKRGRPYPFNSTNDTTSYSFSIAVAALTRLAWRNSFHIHRTKLAWTGILPKTFADHLLLFEDDTRKAEQKLLWNVMCS